MRGRDLDIRIRPLRRADRRHVREIARSVWGPNDYIVSVFARWVREGGFYGAEVGSQLVGFAKLTPLSRSEAWLEGLRVAPRWRRRGIGTRLVAYRLERAAERGYRVARFVTWSENPGMHRLAPPLGFVPVMRGIGWRARPRWAPQLRRASSRDLPALWRIARTAGGILLYVRGSGESRFRELRRADLTRAAARGCCLVLDGTNGPRGFAIVAPDRDGGLETVYTAAAPRALRSLLLGLRDEAARRRARVVYAGVPAARSGAARAAGFRPRGRGYGVVYEARLPRGRRRGS